MKLLPRSLEPVRVDRQTDASADQDVLEVVRHIFDARSIAAVNGALAACRPLLVRGEPGVGKTQLAAAVAAQLDRPLVSFTVNARTEPHDLLWTFDALQRLAEAQLCGALKQDEAQARTRLEERRFVAPGPLWWGFDWSGARDHMRARNQDDHRSSLTEDASLLPDPGGNPDNGVVVLIDEIDKADSDVPNGLLEALGMNRFTPLGCPPVEAHEPLPLVIITTNEERVLPDAFIRRCLVLHLPFPERDELIARGEAHFGQAHRVVLEKAAEQLLQDREHAIPPRPGLAEYLDLIRAVIGLSCDQSRDENELIEELAEFTFQKQSGGRK